MNRLSTTAVLAAAALFAWTGAGIAADAFPSHPVKLVVPFPPGGSLDIVGREIAQKLGEAWGQSVVVENKPGAGGNIGADYVAKSRAGRLHGGDGRAVDARRQPDALPAHALRRREGFRADLDDRHHAQRARGVGAIAVPLGAGSRGGGEGQSGQARVRLRQHRQRGSSRGRAVQDGDPHRHHACALQRRRAGDAGIARRRHAIHVRQPRQRDGAGQGRQGARAGGHHGAALGAGARPADDGRSRPARASTSRRGSD